MKVLGVCECSSAQSIESEASLRKGNTKVFWWCVLSRILGYHGKRCLFFSLFIVSWIFMLFLWVE